MMDTTIIRLADLPRQRWKNNGGWTHEIARGGGEDWLWRVSVADVESDGAFSLFPGMLRELLILSGEGVALQFENGQTIALTPEQPRLRFDGDQPIYSRLLDGAVRDVDALAAMDIGVWACGATPSGPYKDGPGEINVPIAIDGMVIEPGDLVIGDDDGLLCVPYAEAANLLAAAQAKQEVEARMVAGIADGSYDRSWVDATLKRLNCQMPE